MFVTYSPEGGDVQRWAFNPKRVRAAKAEMIEKRAGVNWDAWLVAVQSGNMRARRVLLWHLMTVEHPTMRWEDVPDFYAGEVLVEHSAAELVEIRAKVAGAALPADQRETILAALDGEIAAATAREVEPEGKARSESAASDTPSPSPKS